MTKVAVIVWARWAAITADLFELPGVELVGVADRCAGPEAVARHCGTRLYSDYINCWMSKSRTP